MFKAVKNFVRKRLFNQFGYDIVPLSPNVPTPDVFPKPMRPASAGNYNLDLYIAWFGEQAVQERRFYNVGASSHFSHPAWTRIDKPSEHYGYGHMDIAWDLLSGEPLPVESGKAKVVFSRYTLEHVTNQAVAHFLSEAYRILDEDGYLRIIVPDIDIYYSAYLLEDEVFYYRPKHDLKTFPNEDCLSNINQASFEQKLLWNFASSASLLHPDHRSQKISDQELRKVFSEMEFGDALDYCISKCSVEVQAQYPQNHINWFTANKLGNMIREAGFENVYRSGYGQSRCAALRDTKLLDDREPEVGLFMEAQKSKPNRS